MLSLYPLNLTQSHLLKCSIHEIILHINHYKYLSSHLLSPVFSFTMPILTEYIA